MITDQRLPLAVEQITPEWLSEALGARVAGAVESSTIRGTGTKVFLDWAITPPVMQPVERVAVMAERHLAAIEDLDTLAALQA